jgi:hypothetical protein
MKRILMGMAGAMLALVVIDTAQAGDWGYGHHRGYTGHYDYLHFPLSPHCETSKFPGISRGL